MLALALTLSATRRRAVASGVLNYLRPDGTSFYRRPDALSLYKRPA